MSNKKKQNHQGMLYLGLALLATVSVGLWVSIEHLPIELQPGFKIVAVVTTTIIMGAVLIDMTRGWFK